VARGFEGGQTPLKQRVPKLSGFNNPFRVEYQAINLHALNDLATEIGADIDLDALVKSGLLTKGDFAKILARGEITTKVNVHAHGASAAAVSAIEAAGGSVTLVTLPFMEEGKAGRPAVQGNQFANR
jgi:large subunit ribosomal protein L15